MGSIGKWGTTVPSPQNLIDTKTYGDDTNAKRLER